MKTRYVCAQVLSWIPPLCWMGLLYHLLTKPMDTEKLAWLPEHADKVVHFGFFLIMSWLFIYPFRVSLAMSWRKCAWCSFILATAFGVWTEWIQSGLPHRQTDLMDVMANILGAGTVFLLRSRRLDPTLKIDI